MSFLFFYLVPPIQEQKDWLIIDIIW